MTAWYWKFILPFQSLCVALIHSAAMNSIFILFSSPIPFFFFLLVLFALGLFSHSVSHKQSFWILLKIFWIQNHCGFSFHLLSFIHSLASLFIHFKGRKKENCIQNCLLLQLKFLFIWWFFYSRFIIQDSQNHEN